MIGRQPDEAIPVIKPDVWGQQPVFPEGTNINRIGKYPIQSETVRARLGFSPGATGRNFPEEEITEGI